MYVLFCNIKTIYICCIEITKLKQTIKSNIMKAITLTQALNYTQVRLNNWYENAKEDFNVEGSAEVSFKPENEAIVITYTENGVTGQFELKYWQDQAIDWVFDVWSESANIENDKVA